MDGMRQMWHATTINNDDDDDRPHHHLDRHYQDCEKFAIKNEIT